jgi:processive 1,2-diacylglycerol beta-glucosyltransferase
MHEVTSNLKIVILTASYGKGHLQVAYSLYKECMKRELTNVKICNLYSESNPLVAEITEKLYKKSFTIGRHFYKLFYYGTDKVHNNKLFRRYFYYGFKRLTSLIQEEEPDILINTFPIYAVPEFRRKTGKFIPTFNILTDYCLHRLWLHKEVDKYYVATPELKAKIMKHGIPEAKVAVSGIPIRHAFSERVDSQSLYEKYQLSPSKKIVLLIAGAYGVLKNIKEICLELLVSTDYQVAVVCGNNHVLQKELHMLEDNFKERFHAFGYVERIDELFRLATVMVTKPGGVTLTETTAIGTPLVLYKPVPGQERENALYFEEKDSAVIVHDQEDMVPTITSLTENEEWQILMQTSLKQLFIPNSSEIIMEDILKETKKLSKGTSALHSKERTLL